MNTNTQSCNSKGIRVTVNSASVAEAQPPERPPFNSTVSIPPAAYNEDAADEAARCQPRQHREPQVTHGPQHLMQPQHRGPRQRLEVPQGTTAGPGVARSLFGEPLSRVQLDRLFREQQEQSEQHFKDKWNFDVAEEVPVAGHWRYASASQQ